MQRMAAAWEQFLEKWQNAGLIDPDAASRIREFEGQGGGGPAGLRWPAIAAIAFGSIMMIAGVLLFVSAHWDDLAPSMRFALVLLMVAAFHLAGAWASQTVEPLAIALHGIGTAALGAGIYLAGQIFNMSEHWPSGLLMWAAGAWIGWILRRDWVQLTFAAILTPAWIGSEWMDAHAANDAYFARIICQGMLVLAIAYFTAPKTRALIWIGGIMLLPWTLALIFSRQIAPSAAPEGGAVESVLAYALPLSVAYLLRRKLAWMNCVAAVWVLLLNLAAKNADSPLLYLWCGAGAAGLVFWGMEEHRAERINLGMAAFAITVLFFYFSSVMDKIGRSASLIGFGVLFLAGGWALEKLRRRLVAQVRMRASV
ncbi:MAG TPA: DUF2157 domain-containing protein [Bryobacteraceae bacterium]|nr:DUF2157 domain-containing protein [Bryobacteraceae bacterium]